MKSQVKGHTWAVTTCDVGLCVGLISVSWTDSEPEDYDSVVIIQTNTVCEYRTHLEVEKT